MYRFYAYQSLDMFPYLESQLRIEKFSDIDVKSENHLNKSGHFTDLQSSPLSEDSIPLLLHFNYSQ